MQELYRHLSKRELEALLEIVHQSLLVEQDDELHSLLLRVKEFVPCANIVAGLGRIGPSRNFDGFLKIVNVSYPLDWIALYLEKGYEAVDPVLKRNFHSFQTQLWSDTFREATSPREKAFVKHAADFGLVQGITIGMPARRHSAGSVFSFAGPEMGEHPRHATVLEYLLPHLHVALMRIAFSPGGKALSLSPREREVLQWMKEGKTSWEVSQILRLSERTVNFHVQNVLAKLHASNRSQAVAVAIEQGLIGL